MNAPVDSFSASNIVSSPLSLLLSGTELLRPPTPEGWKRAILRGVLLVDGMLTICKQDDALDMLSLVNERSDKAAVGARAAIALDVSLD